MIIQVANNSKQRFSGISQVISGLNFDNSDKIYDSKTILKFLLNGHKSSIIIVHGIFNIYSLLCPVLFKNKNLHLILHGQTQSFEKNLYLKKCYLYIFKKFLKNYNTIQYLSNAELKSCKLKTTISSNKIVIPNGVKLVKHKKKNHFNNPLRFLYIGRIDEDQKGLLSFFLSKINTNAVFNLYGPDSKTKQDLLKLNHRNLKIHDPVYELKQKQALFIEHDFAFLTSYFEGLPIFGLEALSHGLPLVCTESCNLSFLKKSKSLIILKNQKEIINFIESIDIRDYNRSEMFDSAKLVVKDLSWDRIKKEICSIYF